MYKKFYLPLNIFLIFEKINLNFFYSKNSKFKNFFFNIPHGWLYAITIAIKFELFQNNTSLLEASAVDLKKFNILNSDLFKKQNLIFYTFFNYSTKNHLTFITTFSKYKSLKSLDMIFFSANWLERELSEMYGIFFYNKKDIRKLLLDYSKNESPLLKDFPCEGFSDVYYNFFDSQINYIKNEVVEL